MKTLQMSEIIKDNRLRRKVVLRIIEGGVFLYPTDTVYGLGCDATNTASVGRIRKIKTSKKTANSSVHFAAGYYCLQFPMGWRPSFCPRYDTLEKYTFAGPFKSEEDMNLVLKRKGQEHEISNN